MEKTASLSSSPSSSSSSSLSSSPSPSLPQSCCHYIADVLIYAKNFKNQLSIRCDDNIRYEATANLHFCSFDEFQLENCSQDFQLFLLDNINLFPNLIFEITLL
ncbi:hypothetical protein Glove_318g56 [Diversispora epigaea]|uniref:Uncharacterized protein n=1 Tax=Diversispora epigaea TaxID=1348612 RepID=A0A397HQH9_9GLOM|nr:hypothetical protein Glove_318g56 [Diversispora epigaea]